MNPPRLVISILLSAALVGWAGGCFDPIPAGLDGKIAKDASHDGPIHDGPTVDGKTTDGKATDGKAADSKPADGKPADGKPADKKVQGDQACQPECAKKACGASDGCGGTCQTGTCSKLNTTCKAGKCVCNYLICGSTCCAYGQTCSSGTCDTSYPYALGAGASDYDSGSTVVTDDVGNVYVAGSYNGSVTFGTTTLTSKGGSDLFVAKISPQGKFVWAVSAGNADSNGAYGIARDGSGNLYLTGTYMSTLTLGSTTLTPKSTMVLSTYVAKMSPTGTFLWAKGVSSTSHVSADNIAVDAAGASYVVGEFTAPSVSFGPTVLTNTGSGTHPPDDIFVTKLDTSGKFVWAVSAGGAGDKDYGSDVAVDSAGNTYIGGYYLSSSATFGTHKITNKGSSDTYLAKLSPAGKFSWAVSAGGSGKDEAFGVTCDPSGNAYLAGTYAGTASFGTFSRNAKGPADMFAVKVSPTGTIVWVATGGSSSTDRCESIASDANGNIYIAGRVYSVCTFDSISVTPYATDVLVAKISPAGKFLAAATNKGTGMDYVKDLAVDAAGAAYTTGWFTSNTSFQGTALTNAGNWDFFLWKTIP